MFRSLMALCLSLTTLIATGLPAAAQSYRIKEGDVLRVEVLEDATLNREVLVLPDGRISLPLAGAVSASGRTLEQIEAALASKLMPNFATRPNVFVSIARLSAPKATGGGGPVAPAALTVYVLGEAASPGKVSVESGTTMLQLFAQIGGFSNFAATKRIQLRRTDPKTKVEKIYRLNYNAIREGTSKNGLMPVADGDVILVPQRRLFE